MKIETGRMTEVSDIGEKGKITLRPELPEQGGATTDEKGLHGEAVNPGGNTFSKMREPYTRVKRGPEEKNGFEHHERESRGFGKLLDLILDYKSLSKEEREKLGRFRTAVEGADGAQEEKTASDAVQDMGDGLSLMMRSHRWEDQFIRGFKLMDKLLLEHPDCTTADGKELRKAFFGEEEGEQEESVQESYNLFTENIKNVKQGDKIDVKVIKNMVPAEAQGMFDDWVGLLGDTITVAGGIGTGGVAPGAPIVFVGDARRDGGAHDTGGHESHANGHGSGNGTLYWVFTIGGIILAIFIVGSGAVGDLVKEAVDD